jgi:hypothetical protein
MSAKQLSLIDMEPMLAKPKKKAISPSQKIANLEFRVTQLEIEMTILKAKLEGRDYA